MDHGGKWKEISFLEPIPFPLTRDEENSAVLHILKLFDVPCHRLTDPIYKREHAITLLDHWYQTSESWIGPPILQKLMQQHGVRMGLEAPFMLNAILAFSASHMALVYPKDYKFQVAASLHYGHALGSYSSQLSQLVEHHADYCFGSCFLLTMLIFFNTTQALIGKTPKKEAQDLGWVKIMSGINVLSRDANFQIYKDESIWKPIFDEHNARESQISTPLNFQLPLGMPEWVIPLMNLFESDDMMMINQANPYQTPVQNLIYLATLEQESLNIGNFLLFIEKLSDPFIQLLQEYNDGALIILCYWCALFSGIDQWWIHESAKQHCRFICERLSHTSDHRIQSLLIFPAQKCNYELA
jgi:hypothetical protein